MLLQKILLVQSICILSTLAISLDISQIHNYLSGALTCLENLQPLCENATIETSVSLAFLSNILIHNPKMPEYLNTALLSLQSRLRNLIQNSYNVNTKAASRDLWFSEYWSTVHYFSYKSPGLKKLLPLQGVSYFDVLERSLNTPHIMECINDVYVENGKSNGPKECCLSCIDEMESEDFDCGVSPQQRALYVSLSVVYNCSNIPETEFNDMVRNMCSYTKLEVDVMTKKSNQKYWKDSLWYPLKKVAFCGTWGFSEFYRDEILFPILQLIEENGCIGNNMCIYDRQALTAQAAVIFTGLYRYYVEMGKYPQPCYVQ